MAPLKVLQAKFGFTVEHIVATADQLGLQRFPDTPSITLGDVRDHRAVTERVRTSSPTATSGWTLSPRPPHWLWAAGLDAVIRMAGRDCGWPGHRRGAGWHVRVVVAEHRHRHRPRSSLRVESVRSHRWSRGSAPSTAVDDTLPQRKCSFGSTRAAGMSATGSAARGLVVGQSQHDFARNGRLG